ncbi:MAG: Holliday junction resolvase RuvX [Eubacteriales bacterium]|nr:Holliday junction resolvase RuvX [Eubacteriales bacterium]
MQQRLIGLDIGDRRIGVAVCDMLRVAASPKEVYTRTGDDSADIKYFVELFKSLNAEYFVIGMPLNMDGSRGFQSEKVLEFAKKLQDAGLKTVFIDERLSTKSAERAMIEGNVRRDKRKKSIDSVAAALILQNYLDSNTR